MTYKIGASKEHDGSSLMSFLYELRKYLRLITALYITMAVEISRYLHKFTQTCVRILFHIQMATWKDFVHLQNRQPWILIVLDIDVLNFWNTHRPLIQIYTMLKQLGKPSKPYTVSETGDMIRHEWRHLPFMSSVLLPLSSYLTRIPYMCGKS